MIRASRKNSRSPEQTAKRFDTVPLPAPIRGWVSNAPLADSLPQAAEVNINFIPTNKGMRPRGGAVLQSTLSGLAVESLMVYHSATDEKCFAASGGSIYDISNPPSPTASISPAFSSQTNDEYSHINFSTAGGQFLLAVNGADPHLVFDGTTWAANTPAITGVATEDVSQIWVHANRVWMVKNDSQSAYYLGVDAIGGAALDFAVPFVRGGKLVFGGTLSNDSGTGSDDRCVFVSNLGEVAIYGGDNPSSNFSLFGRYDIAEPMGKFAHQKVGGDLLVMTRSGIVPLSEAISKDPAALTMSAITRNIEPEWSEFTEAFKTRNWHFTKWDERGLGIVAIPNTSTETAGSSIWGSTFVWGVTPWGENWSFEVPDGIAQCFVVNLHNGAWCRVTGWDCRCMAVFKGEFLFGNSSGQIMYGDKGGSDNGFPYICRMVYWPSSFGVQGEKQFLQARAGFEHSTSFNLKITMSSNNTVLWGDAPLPPDDDPPIAIVDGEKRVSYTRWKTLNKRGRSGALMLQMTFNNTFTPDIEMIEAIITFEKAGVVV